jgi:hypothetical protein
MVTGNVTVADMTAVLSRAGLHRGSSPSAPGLAWL